LKFRKRFFAKNGVKKSKTGCERTLV